MSQNNQEQQQTQEQKDYPVEPIAPELGYTSNIGR